MLYAMLVVVGCLLVAAAPLEAYASPYEALIFETGNVNESATASSKTGKSAKLNEANDSAIIVFTIANTDTGTPWNGIPFREAHLRKRQHGPCKIFTLKLPDEDASRTSVDICLFRSKLEAPFGTSEALLRQVDPFAAIGRSVNEVEGHIVGKSHSEVVGYMVDTFFYGKVSFVDGKKKLSYFIEEAAVLTGLVNYDAKLLRSLFYVLIPPKTASNKTAEMAYPYNAVVTKGASMDDIQSQSRIGRSAGSDKKSSNSFLALSMNENTFLMLGTPEIIVDEAGSLKLSTIQGTIRIDMEPPISLETQDVHYVIHPMDVATSSTGTTIRKLRKQEGSVAIMAVSRETTFNCLLPPPSFSKTRIGGYVCRVCVHRDKSFMDNFVPNVDLDDMDVLHYVIDQVSWILRSTDWNDDKFNDNIGLLYDETPFIWEPTIPDFTGEVDSDQIEAIFIDLSQTDFSHCCLAIAFTMLPFETKTLAMVSPRGSQPLASGICARKTSESAQTSNNVILISANHPTSRNRSMAVEDLVYLTSHQIGLSFGAKDDRSGPESCHEFEAGNGQKRHYLMWPPFSVLAENGHLKMEEKRFSTCSIKAIEESLSTCKTACFELSPYPFCGNGIVEDGEECDCGDPLSCSKQTCCYSRMDKSPCMKTGLQCSGTQSFHDTPAAMILWLATAVLVLINIF